MSLANASSLLVLALAAAMLLVPSRAATANPRAEHAWRERPVLVFAAEADPRGARQIAALEAQRSALAERQMPVLLVGAAAVETALGRSSVRGAAELRRLYNIEPDGFAVVLIGKDGGEKFRSAEPVSVETLLSRVDEMPMRRREMRGG